MPSEVFRELLEAPRFRILHDISARHCTDFTASKQSIQMMGVVCCPKNILSCECGWLGQRALLNYLAHASTNPLFVHFMSTMDRSHWKKTRENANYLQEFVHKRCAKCPSFARTHAWRRFLHWSIAVSIMSCQKLEHTAIKRSFSLLHLA